MQAGQDADVGRDYRFGFQTLAVTGHRHVTHHVDIGHMLAEEVDARLGGFGHAFHEFLLLDVPLVVLARGGVNPCLADASVGTTDADVLVRAAKAALGMALEMGQRHHGIIVLQVAAHRHLVKPLSAHDRQRHGVLLVKDIHGAEGPAVHLQRLAVQFGGVTVALIVGVGLDDGGTLQVLLHQSLDPSTRDDVGAMLLARVQLHCYAALDHLVDLLIGHDQSLGTQVAGEIDHRLVAGALVIGDILVAVNAGYGFLFHVVVVLL